MSYSSKKIAYILTDIEGTTTSISFVYDVLFPYFRNNIEKLENRLDLPEVVEAFEQTIELGLKNENIYLSKNKEIIQKLLNWSLEDKKITPLKTVQGILWKEGYESGEIKGHVYADVAPNLKKWKDSGIQLAVFSSGSVMAQQLIFKYSESGDLSRYFSHYFDTKTGEKKKSNTYKKIAEILNVHPNQILFLSDVTDELLAAKSEGFQTIQILRDSKTLANWEYTATNFDQILV
jgi:enolase-phosphatase E1